MIDLSNLTEKEKEFILLAANGIIAALFAMENDNNPLTVDTCVETMDQVSRTLNKQDTYDLNIKIVEALKSSGNPNYVVGTVDFDDLRDRSYQELKEVAILKKMHEQ